SQPVAAIARIIGLTDPPAGRGFDDVLLHVDGYLCELKDAQIRGGLHTLGLPPSGATLIDPIRAITRLPPRPMPSLWATVAPELGVDANDPRSLDAIETRARQLVQDAANRDWSL